MKKIKNHLTYVMLLFILVAPIQAVKKKEESFRDRVMKSMEENPSATCGVIASLATGGTVAVGLGTIDKVATGTMAATGSITFAGGVGAAWIVGTTVVAGGSFIAAYNICAKAKEKFE